MGVWKNGILFFHHFCFMMYIFFFLIFPSATSLFFNFSSFDANNTGNRILLEKDASYSPDDRINLTREDGYFSWGRATYIHELHLWDKASGNLADFTTNFSFVIDSRNATIYADGLTFFLAPNDTKLPSIVTGGSGLGLVSDNQVLNDPAQNHFVAVEFDTWQHRWDPSPEHVGININSMVSVNSSSWLCNIREGKRNHAWIRYTSSSKLLSVVWSTELDNKTTLQDLSYQVDLRDWLSEYVTIGFSAATGSFTETHQIESWNFSSTLELPNPPKRTEDGNKTGLAVGLSSCAFFVVGGLGLAWYYLWKESNNAEKVDDHELDLSMDDDFEKGSGPRKFSYDELALATSNFSEGEKLGEGGFGGVYRGFLRELSSYVAVKRISRDSKQGIKEYASEVKIISRLRHRSLVQLLGWCHQKKELLLVYELMPNGSLDSCLFGQKTLLTWPMRYGIALGLASGILYLHEEWEQCVVHRDIKSSNVMLDSGFHAKLGDFGLARLVDHGQGSQTTLLAGTIGYMAPECIMTGKASKETDVYSFGVVVLEICCGRRPMMQTDKENQSYLVGWVWKLYGVGKLLEAADPRLSADFDEQQMRTLMIVGLWCAHPDCNLRPSIRQAINVLNLEAPLPLLPLNLPVPTYHVAPTARIVSSVFPLTSFGTITISEIDQTQLFNFSNGKHSSKFMETSLTDSPSTPLSVGVN